MLTNLHVKNLALIDEAEVEFGPGLNILTGETGAGKSILIGSINAALGKKISREMIRTGETSALVELVFETENPHVLELLKEMDLEAEEGQVIISRKITGSRSVCRINGEACNISQVKALASLLLDIHGQHEHQSLLYPDRQIAILDAFAGTEAATAKGEVRALYQEWKNVRKELSAYELDEEARKREAAFLTFEINEIDQAELKEGEDEVGNCVPENGPCEKDRGISADGICDHRLRCREQRRGAGRPRNPGAAAGRGVRRCTFRSVADPFRY